MAKWKETLEPYVKVIESVRTFPSNPDAGEDFIVGAVIISDSGPATPTLITSQSEFLRTYAAQDLTQDYTDSLNSLYVSDPGSSLASTMWLNAYRLAGSTHMLICRASKAKDLLYAKPIAKGDQNAYVLKNTEILKRVPSFKFVLDKETAGWNDGWAISISDTGILGNKVTDDGPVYDYKIDTLPDLVDQLNDSTKFFSPTFEFYKDVKCTEESLVEGDAIAEEADEIVAVLFKEVYLASNFIDQDVPLVDIINNETGDVVYDLPYLPGSAEYQAEYASWLAQQTEEVQAKTESEKKALFEAYASDEIIIGDGKNDYTVIGATGSNYEVKGMCYILAVDPNWEELSSESNNVLDLNSTAYSGFEDVPYYATNLYNSRSDLQVRIRRFNHNAVVTKVTSDIEGMQPESPYTIASKVLDKYTKNGTADPKEAVLKYDFYEFAVFDPDISKSWQLFNVGNIGGRGDITVADLNDNLSMIHLKLPDNLKDLDLNYYGYQKDNYNFVKQNQNPQLGPKSGTIKVSNISDLPEIKYKKNGKLNGLVDGTEYSVIVEPHYDIYQYSVVDTVGSWNVIENGTNVTDISSSNYTNIVPKFTAPTSSDTAAEGAYYIMYNTSKSLFDIYKLQSNGDDEILLNLSVKRTNSVTGEILTTILDVSDNDLMLAWDRIEEDERYVVEGMTDLGNTYSILQNYMANIAVNSNYFYAVSTINSTNYMTIANKKQKITKNTPKLYFLSPWDYDDGTVGYLFPASPSTLYWECISRNRTNNNWFAPAFGQTTGIVTPVKLTTEFKKSERQLLLTKKINTIFHDLNIERIYINDSYTATTDDNIRKEENIERSIIHISKAMPTLLNQFKGRINSQKTRKEVEDVINYWFKTHMIRVSGDLIDDWLVVVDNTDTINPPEEQRKNKLNVLVQVRYRNAIKYIIKSVTNGGVFKIYQIAGTDLFLISSLWKHKFNDYRVK